MHAGARELSQVFLRPALNTNPLAVLGGIRRRARRWERYDPLKGEPYNRDDHPNDHTYLIRASLPENVKQALAEGHNQRVFCARDEAMHLSCPRGGSLK